MGNREELRVRERIVNIIWLSIVSAFTWCFGALIGYLYARDFKYNNSFTIWLFISFIIGFIINIFWNTFYLWVLDKIKKRYKRQ